jgi:hypothetical protein
MGQRPAGPAGSRRSIKSPASICMAMDMSQTPGRNLGWVLFKRFSLNAISVFSDQH